MDDHGPNPPSEQEKRYPMTPPGWPLSVPRPSVRSPRRPPRALSRAARGPVARRASAALARRLLSLEPRSRVLFPCPRAGLLAVNLSPGDRCVRFHEAVALRRVHRTRLDLPRIPRAGPVDLEGLFDAAEFDDGGAAEAGSSWVSSTECSLADLEFLVEESVILGLVSGRAQVRGRPTGASGRGADAGQGVPVGAEEYSVGRRS